MAIASNFPAIKPSLSLDFANTKKLDSRITFTRTTTATYYDGVTTAKAEENLLLQSQDFTTTWTTSNITVTSNTATAPNGTLTAETFDDDTANAVHDVSQTIVTTSGSTYTLSAFLKNVDRQYAILACSGSTTSYASAKFDLSAGTLGSTAASGAGWSVTSSSITSVGSSWYRCSITFVVGTTTGNTARIGMATDGTTFTASQRGLEVYTGSDKTIYVWGAQLEQRSSVTAYTATTTQPITNYIPVLLTAASGVARFDHNPTTDESLGLLIEEARTNLALYSADFTNAVYGTVNASITSNTIVAPDGTLTGDKIIGDTTNGPHLVRQVLSYSATTTYTATIYAKAAEQTFLRFICQISGVGDVNLYVNLTDGSITTTNNTWTVVSTSATLVGNNWYRCSITFTTGATGGLGYLSVGGTTASGTTTYTGNGYSGIYIWGAQLEAGAFPTSYIATTAATVTRNADAASMTGTNFTSWYNAAEGAIYCESQTVSLAANRGIWAIGNPSLSFGSGNMMYAIYDSGVSGRITVNSYTNGSQQVGSLGVVVSQTANTFSKSAYVYKVNDFAQTTNAASVFADTSGTIPIGPTGLSIGGLSQGWSGAIASVNGTIKKISYYPLRVTNAQLQALTS